MKKLFWIFLLFSPLTVLAHSDRDCRSGFAAGYSAAATKKYQQQLIVIERERLAMEREYLELEKQRALNFTCYLNDGELFCKGKMCTRIGDQFSC